MPDTTPPSPTAARPPLPNLDNLAYEFERLQRSLEYGRANGFTPGELLTLVKGFKYENSKLDFLIRAYPMALEKDQFPQLADVLEFPESKARLAQETWKK